MRVDCSLEHSVAGRARFRLAPKSALRYCGRALRAFLANRVGTTDVRLSPHAASVVIGFDPRRLTPAQLADEIRSFVADHLRDRTTQLRETASAYRGDLLVTSSRLADEPQYTPADGQPRGSSFQGLASLAQRAATLLSPLAGDGADGTTTRPSIGNGLPTGRLGESPSGPASQEDGPASSDDTEPTTPIVPWHALAADDVVERLGASIDRGLTLDAATDRLVAFGPNSLGGVKQRSQWSILAGQFTSLPVALLLGSAVISVATGGIADAAVILAVVLINAAIGDVTEQRAEATIASLLDEQVPPAIVLREGFRQQIASELVVPGDLLIISPGSTIAADARLVRAERLLVDESALTGESQPVEKASSAFDMQEVALRDRRNMIYRGTVATGGSGLAVVVATGKLTEVGKIEGLVATAETPETPVQRQLRELGSKLGIASGVVCLGIFAIGAMRGQGLIEMLNTATSLAVAAIPEGLPMVATTTLALGVTRMRKRNVSVRRLDAVEALGAIQVFCLDKTGTLTQNKMRVQRLFVGMEMLAVDEQGVHRLCEYGSDPDSADVSIDISRAGDSAIGYVLPTETRRLLEVGALCSEAEIDDDGDERELHGSPTEAALVQVAFDAGIDVVPLRADHPVERTEYRTENRSFMTTVHRRPIGIDDGEVHGWLVAVKGRPADVLELCRWQLRQGERIELTAADRDRIRTANERLAGEALRVLGFACRDHGRDWSHDSGEDDRDLIWLGLAGIADPVRPGMKDLMQTFHQSGIRTVMITGDQSATAYAIGRQLNLSGERRLDLIDSTELEKIDPDVLKSLAQEVEVFSAVTPSHKLEIVQALQRAGLVVAMTGDGINDGPALRAADIGVAMGGAKGTEVARRTADVVLEDDNLHTMVEAIAQGRTIYGNTRNAIRYLKCLPPT